MLIAALGLALLCIPKEDLHLWLCDRHTPARDFIYRYYTQIAEWFPYVVCIALLLFNRIGNGIFASCCMIGSALTTQLLKHLINAPRPATWFAEHMPDIQLPLVDGVQMNAWYSFPSGHTTSFFALAFAVCILITNHLAEKRDNSGIKGRACLIALAVQILLFLLAALGGYSRIYLSQHFTLDVLGGVVVGILITIVCYAIFSRFEDKKWYNYRLFSKK